MTEQRTTTRPCLLHRKHAPEPVFNHLHHEWPLGEGGPDIPTNMVVVCPAGHDRIHQLLNAYRRAGGDPGWMVRRRYYVAERRVAALGWARMQRGAM